MTANYEGAVMEHVVDLYEEGGQLLALIEMIPKRDHLLIENIAVRLDRQEKGLGDRLLRHAEGIALILGFAEVQLDTNAAFISNLAFYRKRGYQEYRRGTMVPGSTMVFMRKGLRGTRCRCWSGIGLGCAKPRSDLVVMPCGKTNVRAPVLSPSPQASKFQVRAHRAEFSHGLVPKPPYGAAQGTDAEDCAAQGVGLGRFAWRRSFQKQTCFFQFGGNGHSSAVSMRERSAVHEGEAL
jgi:hypothetical protein